MIEAFTIPTAALALMTHKRPKQVCQELIDNGQLGAAGASVQKPTV